MTKQELLDNKYWQQLPPDTEIVLNTSPETERCMPLTFDDLVYKREIVGFAKRELEEPNGIEARYRDYLVINTNRHRYEMMCIKR